MFRYSKTAALVAIAALSAPAVCQAQDLVGGLGQAEKLNQAGRSAEAVELCDKVIKKFESKSRITQQFEYLLPFYYWQKALGEMKQKKYDAAFETFKKIAEDEKWQSKDMRDRAKTAQAQSSGGKSKVKPVGYDPLLTMSTFQMGYARFKQAAGEEGAKGDVAKFDEAIKYLETYLDMLEKGKVSAFEKEQKLNGQVCFLLLQSYLLKDNPDFKKGAEYLERSRKGKGKLPEDMVMNGLNTIIGVALNDSKRGSAEVMDLAYKALATIPAMEPTAAASNVSRFVSYGSKAASVSQKALKEGDVASAEAAARIMATLFGMVPGSTEVMDQLTIQAGFVGKDATVQIPSDVQTGKRYSVKGTNTLMESYRKVLDANTDPEAYTVLSAGNVSLAMGSNRMGKASFQVLLDRYPSISIKGKEGKSESLDQKLKFQLAQLHYITGNEAMGEKIEATLKGGDLGGDQAKNLAFNKMRRLLKEENWAQVIPAAENVIKLNSDNPSGVAAATARFVISAANFKLNKPDEVVKATEEFLASGNLKAGSGKGALKQSQVEDYEKQLYFFLEDSYNKLGVVDPQNYDKALSTYEKYREKYPSNDLAENKLAPNAAYVAVDTLLKRATTQDEEGSKADMAKALELCKLIADNWQTSDVYPTAQLLRGNILINGEDEALKPEGMEALQMAYEAALQQPKGKGKPIAANALYLLYSYAPEFPKEGETPEALAARVQGYADTFWNSCDAEGNNYALDMSGLQLRRASKDAANKDAFTKALAKAQEIIGREATYSFKNNRTNKGLEMAINSYVAAYADGSKTVMGEELTPEKIIAHLEAFPGVDANDKYTQAILYMARITQMQAEIAALRGSTKEGATQADVQATNTKVQKMREGIQNQIRQMRFKFQPSDLTDFICLQVGDNLVNFVEMIGGGDAGSDDLNAAIAYYDKVIERNSPKTAEAKAGKARATKLGGNLDGAIALLNEVVAPGACQDTTVLSNALYTLTECYAQKGDATKAVEIGKQYLNTRGATRRMDMNMLLGDAYAKSGDVKNALVTYMNIYSSNKGNVAYSAPACAALMKIMWERNTPSSGDRMKGDFKASDRWTAWNTGADYVKVLKANKFEEKMNTDEKTAFREVEKLVEQYGNDPAVQREQSENVRFKQQFNR